MAAQALGSSLALGSDLHLRVLWISSVASLMLPFSSGDEDCDSALPVYPRSEVRGQGRRLLPPLSKYLLSLTGAWLIDFSWQASEKDG